MIHTGDCLEVMRGMDAGSIQTCVTSPPYFGLRDYGVDGQLGLEKTPDEYVDRMVRVFREIGRVLKNDGTVWLNLGDSYSSGGNGGGDGIQRSNKGSLVGRKNPPPGLKVKDLIGIPWRVAFALRSYGWYLRQDIIWNKPNAMPESVTDRCTKSHEYIFLFSKSSKYYYDAAAIAEPLASDPDSWGRHSKKDPGAQALRPRPMFDENRDGTNWGNRKTRNKRSVWTVPTRPYKEAHFATFPLDLIKPCILAGSPEKGIVLDPFAGAGTTGVACKQLDREFVGIELNPEYVVMAEKRIKETHVQLTLDNGKHL